jgi:hypothetical protein
MTTNGGTIIYNQQAELSCYGMVWFNPNSIANIALDFLLTWMFQAYQGTDETGHGVQYEPIRSMCLQSAFCWFKPCSNCP